MKAMGSLARREGADAVDRCKLEYMRGSMMSSNSEKRCSLACCDRMTRKRYMDVIVWKACCAQAALFPKRPNVNSVARKAQTRADSSLRHLPRPAQRN